jgi:hypothetical protein
MSVILSERSESKDLAALSAKSPRKSIGCQKRKEGSRRSRAQTVAAVYDRR